MLRRLIVLLLTMCAASLAPASFAQTAPEKAILGRWYVEIAEPIAPDESGAAGELRVTGVDEYLPNGTLKGQGQIIMLFKYPDGATLEAAWQTASTSEWRIVDGMLHEKTTEVLARPDFVKANGKPADKSDQEEFFRQANFTIEDLMPRGQSTQDQIITIDNERFVYESSDGDGRKTRRTKTRTTKDFAAYKKY